MSDYVKTIVAKYKLPDTVDYQTQVTIVDPISSTIRGWASANYLPLNEIKISGSRAKGTAISLASDIDLFISISSTVNETLATIYNSLYNYFVSHGYICRKQNVSIGVTYLGKKIDLVPGKRQSQWGNDHSLYKNKQQTWTKTNIDTHINTVRSSGRITEIVAGKIWRERHGLEFPSLLLELISINALKYHGADTDSNFLDVLRYFRDHMTSIRVIDPANTNNILSDDLTTAEKSAIVNQASVSLQKQYWSEIIW